MSDNKYILKSVFPMEENYSNHLYLEINDKLPQ